jgi:hypothetical protein
VDDGEPQAPSARTNPRVAKTRSFMCPNLRASDGKDTLSRSADKYYLSRGQRRS